MRITTRLYFAAFPSIAGVLAVAALAYWGQYARTVPEIILVVAAIATLATMTLSWVNVRYVAQRVERLASGGPTSGMPQSAARTRAVVGASVSADELDTIESEVARLKRALVQGERDRASEAAHAQRTRKENAALLAAVAASASRQLDDVRLPLHILLDNHFGVLNENQEEMLGAARTATELVAAEVSALADLGRLDRGQLLLRRDRVFTADVLNAILPIFRTEANASGVQLSIELAPLIPPINVDGAWLQQSLQRIISERIRNAVAGSEMKLSMFLDQNDVVMHLEPAPDAVYSAQTLLAERILGVFGATVSVKNRGLMIRLPT